MYTVISTVASSRPAIMIEYALIINFKPVTNNRRLVIYNNMPNKITTILYEVRDVDLEAILKNPFYNKEVPITEYNVPSKALIKKLTELREHITITIQVIKNEEPLGNTC